MGVHRMSVDISDATFDTLNRCIPHGMKRYVLEALLDDLAKELSKDPLTVLSNVIARKYGVKELMNFGSEQPTQQVRDGHDGRGTNGDSERDPAEVRGGAEEEGGTEAPRIDG